MKLKVCGNILPEQVNALDEMGVQFAGFIFYPSSLRNMRQKISPEKMKQIKGRIAKVGVFNDTPYEEVMKTVEAYRLDMVQLNGDEDPRYCERIADYISVIKVFRLTGENEPASLTEPYNDVCEFFMFKSPGSENARSIKKINWEFLNSFSSPKAFFLAGGIEAGDTERIKEFSKSPAGEKLFAVDINSRFEINPGVKDINKIRNFFTKLNS
ncbi:MAG TPA: phosphoribosylanthranilate isomerase [Chitinophagaceae bacterium]|nr:phosphoribosylanthranilate isomerase [Chitinophagaceae bacterium]